MTQQPFSRPGAIDLSALKAPAPSAPAGGAPASSGSGHSYAIEVDEANVQQVVEASMTAPVLLAFHSPSRMPESSQLAADLAVVGDELEGRVLVGLVDVDAAPQIAQMVQVPSIPFVVAIIDGRPQPLLQDAVPIDSLRQMLQQVVQQLTAAGMTGRHQPRHPQAADGEEEVVDPRYAAAQDALGSGDVDAAVAEYEKLVAANPADTEAAAGLAMAKVLQRTRGVDLHAARAAAAADPADVDAQTLCADLDMLGGHVEDAFNRLVDVVRRTAGDDRTKAREHLLALFAAVGNDDPRVLRGRQNLASALF
ncbi:tetratricopeptide repeat protein [Nocardioides sp. GY 10127]|uniref:co-chaperone YbbN n=1 Tax=Nocardioides sp. GY 10127 TaxID=2569762 RepID=UPI0010A8E3EA|nr:tetratricopeptide repeat protein [Nocardioides sp. GY 10127]TIC84029.1 tetratricopeptide repeat protein [Nocardioides sp. GY 10127]